LQPLRAIFRPVCHKHNETYVKNAHAGNYTAAFDFSLSIFLSLPPNDSIGGSKESGNDFILCKWFELIALLVKRFGQMRLWKYCRVVYSSMKNCIQRLQAT
jgi:hypothetical protein